MASMPVGRMAGAVAAGPDSMWVTSAADGTVWRIDPKTHRVLKLAAHGTPTRVAVDAGKAVVTDGPDRRVLSLNERTGATGFVATLQRNGSGDLLLGDGKAGAWYADPANGVLGKVDDVLASGSPSAQISIPQNNTTFVSPYLNFDGIAVGEGGVWVAGDQQDRVVWRLDPDTHGVTKTIRIPFVASAVAAGAGGVWVALLFGDTVSRIDPRTGRIVATIPSGGDRTRSRSATAPSGSRERSTTRSAASTRGRTASPRPFPSTARRGRSRSERAASG
jgi:streptogramin lyase